MHRILDEHLTLRRFTGADAPSLARHADDRAIWRNLRDGFPHPSALADAEAFLARVEARREHVFCIAWDGDAIGACGIHPLGDVERRAAEVGTWLGTAFHGRGLGTRVVGELTRHGLETLGLARLQAGVFAWNRPSARVLEKNGYSLEAVQPQAVHKDGQVTDALLYVRLARS
jgi:RimJ/RimL family protein N-acetyltransferase